MPCQNIIPHGTDLTSRQRSVSSLSESVIENYEQLSRENEENNNDAGKVTVDQGSEEDKTEWVSVDRENENDND